VLRAIFHESLDVAVLEVSEGSPDSEVLPLSESDALPIGSYVQLAGYGLTELDSMGSLRFAVEPVAVLADKFFRVAGGGKSGACVGDSGGPALVRGETGAVEIAGILTAGSVSCVGRDRYTRTSVMLDWVRANVAEVSAPNPDACAGLTEEGGCYSGRAIFCSADGRIATEACEGAFACTYDDQLGRYGCLVPTESPCLGEDALGTCDGQHARRCESGVLIVEDCDGCSVAQGFAMCLEKQ
jgi:hypothetical protein